MCRVGIFERRHYKAAIKIMVNLRAGLQVCVTLESKTTNTVRQ